jgi:hypothetical protein
MGMECPGSPVLQLRGERRREVIDENDDDDAKQKKLITKKQKKEDEEDLKSALTFEPPPYSAPPPPYSPTVLPPPSVSVVSDLAHFLHRQWREFQFMCPCLKQLMSLHSNLPPRFIIPNQ